MSLQLAASIASVVARDPLCESDGYVSNSNGKSGECLDILY